MAGLFVICHFVMCFVTLMTLVVGLTRKDEKQVDAWHWASRVSWAVMVAGGIGLETMALPALPLHAIIKCALGFVTIFLIERTYGYKKAGELDRNRMICVFSAYALTVACGMLLLARMNFYR